MEIPSPRGGENVFLATRRFLSRRCFDYRRRKKNTTRKDFSGATIRLSGPRDKIRQRDKNRTTREIRCAASRDAFAQVGLAHLGVIQQVAGRAGERNRTRLHDVTAASELQREPCVLLHQQDRHALPRDLAHDVEDLRHHERREPHRRLVQQEQLRRVISARAMASICCSPPESVPATCLRRSLSRGKLAYWGSGSPPPSA